MSELQRSTSINIHHAGFSDVIKAFTERARALTCGQLLFLFFVAMLLMIGNTCQIIAINFWLRDFPEHSSPNYTTFFFSNMFYVVFFSVTLFFYAMSHRDIDYSFVWTRKSVWLLIWIGFGDYANSFLNVYATRGTPMMLQALVNSLQPIFCFIIGRFVLGEDHKQWFNFWCLGSFFLMVAGVCLASAPDFADSKKMSYDQKMWTIIYVISVPLQSWYGVLQGKYLRDFSEPKKKADGDDALFGVDAGQQEQQENRDANNSSTKINSSTNHHSRAAMMNNASFDGPNVERVPLLDNGAAAKSDAGATYGSGGDNNSAVAAGGGSDGKTWWTRDYDDHPKVPEEAAMSVMLLGDTFWQLFFTALSLPADGIPWFGESKSVSDTGANFARGMDCVFGKGPGCENNYGWMLMYCGGFLSVYLGAGYCNRISPVISSSLQNLSGPVAAIVLFIAPALNLNPGSDQWEWTAAAVVLLIIAVVIYTVWEEMTELDEEEEEHVKEEKERLSHQNLHRQSAAALAAEEPEA